MKSYVIAYLAALTAFLIIDAVWLGVISKRFYAEQLGSLMRERVLFAPAAVFYLIYAAGVVILAIRPEQPDLSLVQVALLGALVGFMAYGTYNITNIATLRDWPVRMSMVDWSWGTVLTSIVAVLGALAVRQFR